MYNPCDECKELAGVCKNCELEFYKHQLFALQKENEKRKVITNLFDKEEIIENCTVQIWSNSHTGETSVGWWRNE